MHGHIDLGFRRALHDALREHGYIDLGFRRALYDALREHGYIDLGFRRALYDALREHGLCDLHEAGYVGTLHIVDVVAFLTILHALLVDTMHNLVQTLVNLLGSPSHTH